MGRGVNRAEPIEKLSRKIVTLLLEETQEQKIIKSDKVCVFISHKKEDTEDCNPIAEYLMDTGINVYFEQPK